MHVDLQTIEMCLVPKLCRLGHDTPSISIFFPSLSVQLASLVKPRGSKLLCLQIETASKLARRAVRMDAGLRPAWLVLARCYVRQNEPGLALITLNIVPTPPTPLRKEEVSHHTYFSIGRNSTYGEKCD